MGPSARPARAAPAAKIASEFRPLETGARGGDITRFLEPERVPVSSGPFEPDHPQP